MTVATGPMAPRGTVGLWLVEPDPGSAPGWLYRGCRWMRSAVQFWDGERWGRGASCDHLHHSLESADACGSGRAKARNSGAKRA